MLPPGLAVSPSGLISGTPTQAGSSNLTIQGQDALGKTFSQPFSLTVAGGSRSLIGPGDITFLGYALLHNGPYGQGLTHRYVNGQLRLMYLYFAGNLTGIYSKYNLLEFAPPSPLPLNGGDVFSGIPRQTYTNFANVDNGVNAPPYGDSNMDWCGIYWEDSTQRLWSGSCLDYPQGSVSTTAVASLMWRNIPTTSGPCSNFNGMWGFESIGARAVTGSARHVPQWFQTLTGCGNYVTGFGHYTSLLEQGLGPSLGPLFVLFSDPTSTYPGINYPGNNNGYNIPSSAYRIGADCRSGSGLSCFYPGTSFLSRKLDRGIRANLNVLNYYEGGDPRANPSTRPTVAPVTAGAWQTTHPSTPSVGSPFLSGDPNGYGRWTWEDGYYGSLQWLDNDAGTAPKHGIIGLASLNQGVANYQSSALYADGRTYEFHVYDPADVAACLAGTKQPFDVRPKNVWPVSLPQMPTQPTITDWTSNVSPASRPNTQGLIRGMTYDSTTGLLYVMGSSWAGMPNSGVTQTALWLYVFQAPIVQLGG